MAFGDTTSDSDEIVLEFPSSGKRIENFTSYSFNSSFTTDTDEGTFTIGADQISNAIWEELAIDAVVRLTINGAPQATCHVSRFDPGQDRGGGSTVVITVRDFLGRVVDGHVDPRLEFNENQSLLDVLEGVLADFGITAYDTSNEANRNILTGASRGIPTTKKRGRPIKGFKIHQLKPKMGEGAFAFLKRVAERFGLMVWMSGDGEFAIVGKPDFEQAPAYELVRSVSDPTRTNILGGRAPRDGTHQPAAIVAIGHGGGGEYAKASIRAACINPAVSADLTKIKARYPEVVFDSYANLIKKRDGAAPRFDFAPFHIDAPRVLFFEDDESKDQAQLENFLVKKMAECLYRSVSAPYQIKGHSLNGRIVSVDTTMSVQDDVARLWETMWLMDRTFAKSRGGGTTTSMNLIRLHSYEI